MKKLLAVFCCALVACQPTTETPRPQAAQAVALDRVAVHGSCSAVLEMDLRAGFLSLPVRASLVTAATEAGTMGGASIDVGGIFTARCDVVDGVAVCAQGGLVRPSLADQ